MIDWILKRTQNFEVSINVTTNLESCFKSAQSCFQLVSLLSQFRRCLLGRFNLFPQVLVLPLQVGRPQGDLVLLESLRLPAPPGRLLVLQALLPVLLVLVLLRHRHHLSLPDDRLWSELVHEEGPLLGVKVISWHGGQGQVLGREVLLHPLPPLLLLTLRLGALRLRVQEGLLLLHLHQGACCGRRRSASTPRTGRTSPPSPPPGGLLWS